MFSHVHLHNELAFSVMTSMGSVMVIDWLLMVLGLQVLGHGPWAEYQYHHHPPTVSLFLGEKLYKLEPVWVVCFQQGDYVEFSWLDHKVSAYQNEQLGIFSACECLEYDRQPQTVSSPHEMVHSKDNVVSEISLLELQGLKATQGHLLCTLLHVPSCHTVIFAFGQLHPLSSWLRDMLAPVNGEG